MNHLKDCELAQQARSVSCDAYFRRTTLLAVPARLQVILPSTDAGRGELFSALMVGGGQIEISAAEKLGHKEASQPRRCRSDSGNYLTLSSYVLLHGGTVEALD